MERERKGGTLHVINEVHMGICFSAVITKRLLDKKINPPVINVT